MPLTVLRMLLMIHPRMQFNEGALDCIKLWRGACIQRYLRNIAELMILKIIQQS